uniref:Uncharacterized protein n=1 Tax=Arundo donax TaxID=35708 RepID=A0A0A9HB85_ARUDO
MKISTSPSPGLKQEQHNSSKKKLLLFMDFSTFINSNQAELNESVHQSRARSEAAGAANRRLLVLPGEQPRADLGRVDVGEPVLGDPVPRLGVPHPGDFLGRRRPVTSAPSP